MKTSYIVLGSILAVGGAWAFRADSGSRSTGEAFARKSQGDVKKSVNTDPNLPAHIAEYEKRMAPLTLAMQQMQRDYTDGKTEVAESGAWSLIRDAEGISPQLQLESKRVLGQIRIDQGRYREALTFLQADGVGSNDTSTGLDIALCQLKLGQLKNVQKLVATYPLPSSRIARADLPGTADAVSAEATLQLLRGLQRYYTTSGQEVALRLFRQAAALKPENALIAHYAAESLASLGRESEALPFHAVAAKNGKGWIASKARASLGGYPAADVKATMQKVSLR